MVFSVKKIVASNTSSANVAEGHLVLSLLNARDPKIWRMALDKIGTASFEIKSQKDTTETKLILKPTKGTAEIIATFANQEDAIEALSQASDALRGDNSKKKNKLLPQMQSSTEQVTVPSAENSKWLIVLLGIVIVIGLYYYMTTLIPQEGSFEQNTSAAQTNRAPQEKTGVPVSADEFLNGL